MRISIPPIRPLNSRCFPKLRHHPPTQVETWTLREIWREDYVATTNTESQLSATRSFAVRPSAKLDGQKNLYFAALGQIVQGCLNSSMHMYALLTMTACGMRNVAGVSVDASNSAEFFMAKALPQLRRELASISAGERLVDKQILLDIFYLFAHEWWHERYEIALTHLKIVQTLSVQLDVSLPLDRYVFEGACFDDVMICLESGTRPMRALDWAPPDLTDPEQAEIKKKLEEVRASGLFRKPGGEDEVGFSQRRTLAIFLVPLKSDQKTAPVVVLTPHMGAGLLRAAERIANPSILHLMRDILFLIEVMQYLWISSSPESRYAQWATKKVHAVLHVLLSMHLIGEWECVRLSVVMMMGALSSNRSWKSGEMNSRRLQAALLGKQNHLTVNKTWIASLEATSDTAVNFTDQKMLLWVLVLGAAKTSRNTSHEWFVEQALNAARDLGLRTGDQFQEVLVEYLYLLRSQQTVVQELAAILDIE